MAACDLIAVHCALCIIAEASGILTFTLPKVEAQSHTGHERLVLLI